MKVKTSVSISQRALEKIKRIAKAQDRSVSYILEKFIEAKAAELPEGKKTRHANDETRAGIRALLAVSAASVAMLSIGLAIDKHSPAALHVYPRAKLGVEAQQYTHRV